MTGIDDVHAGALSGAVENDPRPVTDAHSLLRRYGVPEDVISRALRLNEVHTLNRAHVLYEKWADAAYPFLTPERRMQDMESSRFLHTLVREARDGEQ